MTADVESVFAYGAENVFAYGSNMDLDHLVEWCRAHGNPRAEVLAARVGTLADHKLTWNYHSRARKGGAANVVECARASVPGLVLTIPAHTRRSIDHKEGQPTIYDRGAETYEVALANGEIARAWVYKVIPSLCRSEPVWPTRHYLDILINAAKKHGLPEWHVAELEVTPTNHRKS